MHTQEKPCDVEAWLNKLGLPSADRDYKPGHERVLSLIAELENVGLCLQQPRLRVRIAGTNGKGSTSTFLAAALQANGLKVGLYTSPHILAFNERICVQGGAISDASLAALMQQVMPLALKVQASYFETATVLALLYFSQQQVDVGILEAGVGARFDATTALPADMGLLTPIALDHQAWLGDDIETIAADKAHVFNGCKVKISAPQVMDVRHVLDDFDVQIYAEPFQDELKMCGEHQYINAGLALLATQQVAHMLPNIDVSLGARAIAQTQVAGRMQYMAYQTHEFWLDAAHNEHAIQSLLPTLASFEQPFDVIFLCTREDRDLSMCIAELQVYADKVVALTGAEQHKYAGVQGALTAEVLGLQAGRFLVLGSFVTLGETLRWMQAA